MKRGLILVAVLTALVLIASIVIAIVAPALIVPAAFVASIISLFVIVATFVRAVVMREYPLKYPLHGLNVVSSKLTLSDVINNYANVTATAAYRIFGSSRDGMSITCAAALSEA